jgi:hypothetical protein
MLALVSLVLASAQAEAPSADEVAVMAPVEAMFAALAAHDPAALAAQTLPEGGATAVVARADGNTAMHHVSWAEFAAGMPGGDDRLEERLTSRTVRIDGDIAMVWGAYNFYLNGRLLHCGVDHFDLVRRNGAWKVLNITWTQRTEGCGAR